MKFTNRILSIELQNKIIDECIVHDIELEDQLKKYGYDYDDLRYESNEIPKMIEFDYKYQAEPLGKKRRVPVVSFFSGAGGLDLGLEYAGFKSIACIENNRIFCDTLRLNFPETNVIGPPDYSGDVKAHGEIEGILRDIGITNGFEGVFIGGPPCQSFSVAANQRFRRDDNQFKRIGFSNQDHGTLLYDFLWYVGVFKPAAFLIENVPGILDLDNGQQIKHVVGLFAKMGYEITGPVTMDASRYGIPQYRSRVFVVGSLKGKEFTLPNKLNVRVPSYVVFKDEIDGVKNHITRKHKASSVSRYMKLRFGEREPIGRVDRLDPSLPSKTIIAGGTSGGGRSHLHPFIPRTLSVRESARLQTFPDDFVFTGPIARQFTQVGNAVPPMLGQIIGNKLYEVLL